MTPLIQQGIDSGEFRPVNAKEAAIAAGSLFEGALASQPVVVGRDEESTGRLSVANPDGALKPGMPADVTFSE